MLSDIFQFIPANTTLSINAILKETNPKITIIFDLEDALQDVLNTERTKQLKLEGRNNLKEKTLDYGEHLQALTGIRINNIKDLEFYKDIKLLRDINEKVFWSCIFLPKIESRNEIEKYQAIFNENNIKYKELIPIIETAKGVDNAIDLLSKPPTNIFNKIIFGHYDFNLDKGFWPFIDHKSLLFWEITKQLIYACKKNNYTYINGAFFDIDNLSFFKKVVCSIQYLCHENVFGQAAISYKQAEFLCSLKEINSLNYLEIIESKIASDTEKIIEANNIIKKFTKDKLINKSFSFNKKSNLIISPHQYLAAINYLKSCTTKS